MHPRIDPSPELRQLAALQGGVLTTLQAEKFGIGRHGQQRLVRQGLWQRPGPGLLLVHGQPPDWRAWAWAGVLRAGEFARLGGLAAGHLCGLVDSTPDEIVVLHPHVRRLLDTPPVRFRRERDGVRNARSVGSPPRTRIEDTVLDLCTDSPQPSGESAAHWITVAVQRRLTTTHRLLSALNQRPRVSGRRELAELLGDTGAGAQSPLELRYLRDVERAHGLPRGRRQVRDTRTNTLVYRDVYYQQYRVLVELDGRIGHQGAGRFRDFRRDNAALIVGDVTLRYGSADIDQDPCSIAMQVGELLIRAGWTGLPERCPRCQR
ncbi:type IV toxin-antitoxin system AbiEi family antitoxin domain-containing protein [Nakamurella lactea]|uniref:type IV toxin-antitoxin system AbiEi family antitoxin domain-containing protein n=1 Tax=Nakamurella lactea TaxID=459515 RepID=UPI000410E636|nr:type IV toxin-antitoxin system AbiEi family antitoxin domain-containing protein [Nakamurella lactea]